MPGARNLASELRRKVRRVKYINSVDSQWQTPKMNLKVTLFRNRIQFMKTMNKTLTWLFAAVLSVTLVVSAEAQSSKDRTGKVVRIKGDARYSTGNKVWQPLKVGTILKSGSIVQTAPNSYADIVLNEEATANAVAFKTLSTTGPATAASGGGGGGGAIPTPDQDVIRILDDSYLVFDSLSAVNTGADRVTETLLDLKKGSVFGSVKKQAAASRFEVKIPNGVAGIRGTIFLITTSNIACFTGSIIAAYTKANGDVDTPTVGAGQQFNVVTGEGSPIGSALMNYFRQLIQECYYPSGGRPIRGGGPRDRDRGHDHVSQHKPNTPAPPIIYNGE